MHAAVRIGMGASCLVLMHGAAVGHPADSVAIQQLEARVANLERDTKALRQDLTALSGQVQSLNGAVLNLVGEVLKLSSSVNSFPHRLNTEFQKLNQKLADGEHGGADTGVPGRANRTWECGDGSFVANIHLYTEEGSQKIGVTCRKLPQLKISP